jgi:hypothetical protein
MNNPETHRQYWERKTQDDDQKTKKQKKIESFECNMWSKTCGARHVNPFGTSPVFDEVCASHRFTLIVFCCCFFKTFFLFSGHVFAFL